MGSLADCLSKLNIQGAERSDILRRVKQLREIDGATPEIASEKALEQAIRDARTERGSVVSQIDSALDEAGKQKVFGGTPEPTIKPDTDPNGTYIRTQQAQMVDKVRQATDGTTTLKIATPDGEVAAVGGIDSKLRGGLENPTTPAKTAGKKYIEGLGKNLKNPLVLGLGAIGAANVIDRLTDDNPEAFSMADGFNMALVGAVAASPVRLMTKGRGLLDTKLARAREIAGDKFSKDGRWSFRPFWEVADKVNAATDGKFKPYWDKTKQAHADLVNEMEHLSRQYENVVKTAGLKGKNLKESMRRVHDYAIGEQENGAAWLEASGGQGLKWKDLTPQEKSVYQFMRGAYDQAFKRVNEMRVSQGMPELEYRKDYFTFFAAPETRMMDDLGADPWGLGKKGGAPEAKGFPFNRRGNEPHKLDIDANQAFSAYMTSAYHHIHLTPLIRDVVKFIDETPTEVWKKNPAMQTELTRWIYDASGLTDSKLGLGAAKVVAHMMRSNTLAQLGYNLGSAVQQFTSYPNVVNAIGAKATAQGMLEAMKDFHLTDKSSAVIKSKMLRGRVSDVGMGEALADIKKSALEKGALFPMKRLDEFVARSAWYGAYNRFKKMGMDEATAISKADDVVIKTQGEASHLFSSAVQRRLGTKFMTQFATFAINNFAYLRREAFRSGKGTLKEGLSSTRAMTQMMEGAAAAYFINKIYNEYLGTPTQTFDPITAFEDDGIGGVAKNVAAQIPGVSNTMYGGGFFEGPIATRLQRGVGDLVEGDFAGAANQMLPTFLPIPGYRQAERLYKTGSPLPPLRDGAAESGKPVKPKKRKPRKPRKRTRD